MSSAEKPWMKFYPAHWRADQALRVCSLAARGLWIECMCIMHEATPYGHLLLGGRPVTNAQLAALSGTTPDQILDLLDELEAAGVFSRTNKGVIYSRRMSRDDKKTRTAVKNGKNGGNPTLCKEREIPPSVNPEDKGGVKLRGKRKEERIEKISSNEDIQKKPGDRGTRVPEPDTIPEDWVQFAVGEGVPDPNREWLRFTDYWRGKSGKDGIKLDWDATWRNWVRRSTENAKRQPDNRRHHDETSSRPSTYERRRRIAEAFPDCLDDG